MNRIEKMEALAAELTAMIYNHGRRKDIDVTYLKPDEAAMADFSDFQIRYYGLCPINEYFLIWETDPDRSLLYVVNVTHDSELTAAQEAIDLIARKF